jgi:hypothetical protein
MAELDAGEVLQVVVQEPGVIDRHLQDQASRRGMAARWPRWTGRAAGACAVSSPAGGSRSPPRPQAPRRSARWRPAVGGRCQRSLRPYALRRGAPIGSNSRRRRLETPAGSAGALFLTDRPRHLGKSCFQAARRSGSRRTTPALAHPQNLGDGCADPSTSPIASRPPVRIRSWGRGLRAGSRI